MNLREIDKIAMAQSRVSSGQRLPTFSPFNSRSGSTGHVSSIDDGRENSAAIGETSIRWRHRARIASRLLGRVARSRRQLAAAHAFSYSAIDLSSSLQSILSKVHATRHLAFGPLRGATPHPVCSPFLCTYVCIYLYTSTASAR